MTIEIVPRSVADLSSQEQDWLIAACTRNDLIHVDFDYYKNSATARFYSIINDGEPIASFILLFKNVFDGPSMTLVALGGSEPRKWRDKLVDFLEATAKEKKCVEFLMVGPPAWGRLFPEIKLVACVYGKNLR